jgi:hypothetical protein
MQHLEHSQVLNHNNQVVRTTVVTKTNYLTTVVDRRQMIKIRIIPKMIPQIKALANQRRAEVAEEEMILMTVVEVAAGAVPVSVQHIPKARTGEQGVQGKGIQSTSNA